MYVLFNKSGKLAHPELYTGLPARNDWVGIFFEKSGKPVDDGFGRILVTNGTGPPIFLFAIDLETEMAYEIVRQ